MKKNYYEYKVGDLVTLRKNSIDIEDAGIFQVPRNSEEKKEYIGIIIETTPHLDYFFLKVKWISGEYYKVVTCEEVKLYTSKTKKGKKC